MGLRAHDLPESALPERSKTVRSPSSRPKLVLLGALALACYAVHAGRHVLFLIPADALWTCNVGTLLIALGALFGRPRPVAIGVTWIAVGTPLWVLDLVNGASLLLTSFLTHVGGPVLGALILRELRWPQGVWWRAVVALAGLMVLTRLITPAPANVNMAFRVQDGWEHTFTSYPLYLGLLFAGCSLAFFLIDLAGRRLWP